MPQTVIKVLKNGQNLSNAKVVLGWDGIVNLGMSQTVYTDKDGLAIIQHSATGEASIYINGSKMRDTVYTPGSKTVMI